MRKVAVNMSMSLGGFIAGPNDSVERLHEWVYELASWRERHGLAGGRADADTEVLDESFKNTGATVMAVGCSTLERSRGGITLPSMCRYSYLLMILQRSWARKGGRRSPSSPTVSKALLNKRKQSQVTEMSRW
jgi:hypothetical protein